MKKAVSLLILLGLLVGNSCTIADCVVEPTINDLPEDRAISLAKTEWESLYTYDVDNFPHNVNLLEITDGMEARIWSITFFYANQGHAQHTISIDAGSGEVLESYPVDPSRYPWEERKGPFYFWSLADKVLFDIVFIQSPENPGYRRLPLEKDLPMESALEIAQKTVREHFGLQDNDMNELLIDYNFVDFQPSAPTPGDPNRQWSICFRLHKNDMGAYPLLYQVNISAKDGSVCQVYALDDKGNPK